MTLRLFIALLASALLAPACATAAAIDEARPVSEPVLGAPTLHSLGVHWVVGGDANQNAEVCVRLRKSGGEWKDGLPLLKVEQGAHQPEKGAGSVEVPAGARLFAGSSLLLAPDTDYELR